MRIRIPFIFAITLFLAVSTNAQTPGAGANSKIAWDQPAGTLVEAQAYTYKYYPDSAATGTTLVGVTCAGTTAPFQCEVAFPAFTPGSHTLTLTAGNIAGESAKSSPPLSFVFVVTPGIPGNVHIK